MINEQEVMFKGNPNIMYPEAPGRGLSFKCYKCPSIFDRKEALLTHAVLHGADKRFKCHLCDYAVNSSDLLAKHMSKHSNTKMKEPESDTESEPKASSKEFSEPSEPVPQRKVVAVNSSRIKHKCAECPASFSNRSSLSSHMEKHRSTGNQAYKCHKCTFCTKRSDEFKRHLLQHSVSDRKQAASASPTARKRRRGGRTSSGPIECPHCPQQFRDRREFRRHSRKHDSNDGKFPCTECSYTAYREADLRNHYASHNASSSPKEGSEDNEKSMDWQSEPQEGTETSNGSGEAETVEIMRSLPYACEKCPFRTRSQQDLQSHINCHSKNNGGFKCSYCDYNCKRSTLCAKHELLHKKSPRSDIKEYRRDGSLTNSSISISKIDYDRFRKGNPAIKYKPYMAIQCGVRRAVVTFKCFHCPYQTRDYVRYVAHQEYHDGPRRRFLCNDCTYSHKLKVRLEKHILLHTNGSFSDSRSGKVDSNSKSEPALKSPVKVAPRTPSKPVVVQRVMPQTQSSRESMDWAPNTALKCFNELYSTEPSDNEQTNWTKFLVQRVKIENFMSIKTMELATTNILTFQGVGKSASVTALLLGLGYDLLLPDHNPQSLCGINARDFIQRGFEESTIELTLSLHAAPKLQREYGSHLKIIRTLQRGVPLALSYFKVMSADTKERFPRNVEVISRKRIQRIQRHVGIKPEFFWLLLLDETNLSHLLKLHDTSAWYDFYRITYDSKKSKFESRLRLLRLKFKRLQGEIKWRSQKIEFLEEEIFKSEVAGHRLSDDDEKELHDLKIDVDHMQERENEMTTAINSYLNELNKLTNVLTGRLKFRYQEFLHRQDFTGSILVDDKEESLRIWIDKDKQTVAPKTLEEVETLWTSTPRDLQRLAVIGLFFALIDIAECSIFFMDPWSIRSTEFSIPSTAFPLLFELIEKKCSQGHQFVTSLPDDDDDALPASKSSVD